MTVLQPTDYPVNFTIEEVETLRQAAAVLEDICQTMARHECTELEGGYPECPQTFCYDILESVHCHLKNFCEYTPHTMR